MKYRAEWNSLSGQLRIFEGDECVIEDRVDSAWAASKLVKENGFHFRDMWTRGPEDGDLFKAPLKAVEV